MMEKKETVQCRKEFFVPYTIEAQNCTKSGIFGLKNSADKCTFNVSVKKLGFNY